ncbi:unnamed protein product [Somion occarium]|uniref:Uncharacterized protein n=1 Tax=Somion occarium TaxID=3059160 RepID=A0ABP1CT34_9APHY
MRMSPEDRIIRDILQMWMLPLRGKYLVWAIAACCCQGFLLLGYDQGVMHMSGIIGADNQFGRDFNHPGPTQQVTIVAIYDIGCAVGSLIVFFWGKGIGRKRMIMAEALTMLVGTAILTSSTTLAQLIVGSVATGIGNGFDSSSIPLYQSETCGGEIRGALVARVSQFNRYHHWACNRILTRCMAHGLKDEGVRILAQLENLGANHPDVLMKRKEMEASLAQESAGGPFKYRELIQGGRIVNFRRMCLCIGVSVMQQFTGTNMINYLAPVVYQNTMGLSRNLSLSWAVQLLAPSGLHLCFILAAALFSTGIRPAALVPQPWFSSSKYFQVQDTFQ